MPTSTTSPTPRISARSARALATRERVIAAARECVRELGPLDASSNEIARRAGVSWGVIQYHFGSRAGILLAMIEEGFGSLLDTLDATESAEHPIEVVVEAVWEYCTRPDYLLYSDVLRMLRRDPSSEAVVEDMLRESQAKLDQRIARLLSAATVDDDVLRIVRHLVFAAMRGLALRVSIEGDRDDWASERAFLVRALQLAIDDAAAGADVRATGRAVTS